MTMHVYTAVAQGLFFAGFMLFCQGLSACGSDGDSLDPTDDKTHVVLAADWRDFEREMRAAIINDSALDMSILFHRHPHYRFLFFFAKEGEELRKLKLGLGLMTHLPAQKKKKGANANVIIVDKVEDAAGRTASEAKMRDVRLAWTESKASELLAR